VSWARLLRTNIRPRKSRPSKKGRSMRKELRGKLKKKWLGATEAERGQQIQGKNAGVREWAPNDVLTGHGEIKKKRRSKTANFGGVIDSRLPGWGGKKKAYTGTRRLLCGKSLGQQKSGAEDNQAPSALTGQEFLPVRPKRGRKSYTGKKKKKSTEWSDRACWRKGEQRKKKIGGSSKISGYESLEGLGLNNKGV